MINKDAYNSILNEWNKNKIINTLKMFIYCLPFSPDEEHTNT